MVSPDYFRAMRIPLLRGRYFAPSGDTDKNTVIVSATMARRMWGDADPIGREIIAGPNGEFTVVGVVGDVRNLDLSLDTGADDVPVDRPVRLADDDDHRSWR